MDIAICPSCGHLADLSNDTGWCDECSGTTRYSLVCVRCQNEFQSVKQDFICQSCKTEQWANEIEELICKGVSYSRAKSLVAQSNRAICLSCNSRIPRGTKGRHLFCSKPKCKSASRRVKHLRLDKGLTHSEALSQVLAELKDAKNKKAVK